MTDHQNRPRSKVAARGYRRAVQNFDRALARAADVHSTRLAQLQTMEERARINRLRMALFECVP